DAAPRLIVAAGTLRRLGELDGACREVRAIAGPFERAETLPEGLLCRGGVTGEQLDLASHSAPGRMHEGRLSELGVDRFRPGDVSSRLVEAAPHRLQP